MLTGRLVFSITMTPTFTVMHPDVICIRLGSIVNALQERDSQKASRIIGISKEQFLGTVVSVLNEEEVNVLVDMLEQVEILVMLDVFSCAIKSVSDMKEHIMDIASKREAVCSLLLRDDVEHELGDICTLPLLVRDRVSKILKKEYKLK